MILVRSTWVHVTDQNRHKRLARPWMRLVTCALVLTLAVVDLLDSSVTGRERLWWWVFLAAGVALLVYTLIDIRMASHR